MERSQRSCGLLAGRAWEYVMLQAGAMAAGGCRQWEMTVEITLEAKGTEVYVSVGRHALETGSLLLWHDDDGDSSPQGTVLVNQYRSLLRDGVWYTLIRYACECRCRQWAGNVP